MKRALRAGVFAAALASSLAAVAGPRLPVLQQVDLPHSYYWRELYLPQLTTGPSAAAFTPDGRELVYSMAGSLWRQRIGSDEAVELTHAEGAYDYQPDVAKDGGSVVFTRYDGRAMELWRLDLASGAAEALTSNGGVNVEPRLSPDGARIVFVSTAGTGHFNLKIADIGPRGLSNEHFLVAPRQSAIPRYYYSAHDHAINPSWSPDGKRVYFIGNAEVAWGSGFICSVPAVLASADYECTTRHREETTWSARPEVAPDGRRLMYSSYHGRQWHQLALTTTEGAAPLPLTYGEFDRRNARWSPDGRRIAYISNENGNSSLWLQDFHGGARQEIVAKRRRLRDPSMDVTLIVQDPSGQPMPARVSVLGSDRRWHAPADAWMHGDEAYDRDRYPSEPHYFHCRSPCALTLPRGPAKIVVQRGFSHLPRSHSVTTTGGEVRFTLERNELPADFGRYADADLHVHMNYGGHYRATPERLHAQMEAEDLDIVHNLIVNKEERIPDIAYFGAEASSGGGRLLLHGQEYHTSLWGHLGLLHLSDHLLLPDYAAYRHTALTSPWPHNGAVADLAHAQGALVGYVHPFDVPVNLEQAMSYQLPADAVSGKVDYLEVMGFSDHHITAGIWYRLLNLGLRIPAGAGTDAMANYASLRGPIGLTRVFLEVPEEMTPEALKNSLKGGRGFVSNGPLLGLEIGGQRPGGTIAKAGGRFRFRVALRSPVRLDHLELVHNGRAIRSFNLRADPQTHDASGEIEIPQGGWLVLRAFSDQPDPLVLDLYPYATTSPIYIGSPPPAPEDAAYFARWMERVLESAQARDDWNDAGERRDTLAYLEAAREWFICRSQAGCSSAAARPVPSAAAPPPGDRDCPACPAPRSAN